MLTPSPAALLGLLSVVASHVGSPPAVRSAPDPAQVLATIESGVRSDLKNHFAFLTFEHAVRTRLTGEGELTVGLEITTRDLVHPLEVRELAAGLETGLSQFMRREYPRLRLSPASRVTVKRPFSFTENLPTLFATLGAVAIDVPQPGSSVVSPSSPPLGPVDDARARPTTREVDVRSRLGKAFGRRYVVRRLIVSLPTTDAAKVALRIEAVSQGVAKDRVRLGHAARTLAEALVVVGSLKLAAGSVVGFELYDEGTGKRIGLLETFHDGESWSPVEPGADPSQTREGATRPGAAGTLPARARSIPQVGDDPKHERLRPKRVDPYSRPSVPRTPPSYEDLVEVPSSLVAPRGTIRGRIVGRGRKVRGGVFSNANELRTVSFGETVSISTAKNLQYTFGYQRLYQTSDLLDTGKETVTGNLATLSLKYQAPPTLRRNTHLAVGADLSLASRRDRNARIPDDDKQADSFWSALDVWTSHISVVHLLIKRVGPFSHQIEYTQVALASEWFPHHPLRRAYVEFVADDRQDKRFDRLGTVLAGSLYANAGVEASLGGSSSLSIAFPHVFSGQYQEISVAVIRKL